MTPRKPRKMPKNQRAHPRVVELEAALKEAIGWNWGPSEIDDIPVEVLKQVNKALAPTASETACKHTYQLVERVDDGMSFAVDKCSKCGYEYRASMGSPIEEEDQCSVCGGSGCLACAPKCGHEESITDLNGYKVCVGCGQVWEPSALNRSVKP